MTQVGSLSCYLAIVVVSWELRGRIFLPPVSFTLRPVSDTQPHLTTSILCSFPRGFVVTSLVGQGQPGVNTCRTYAASYLALNLSYFFAFSWHTVIQASVRRWWSLTGKEWRGHSGYRWHGKVVVYFFPPSLFLALKLLCHLLSKWCSLMYSIDQNI